MKTLFLILLCNTTFCVTAADPVPRKEAAKAAEPAKETISSQLLSSAKAAQTKLKAKQDYSAELNAITQVKKTIETARLKAAAEFTQQRAALETRKADKAALDALETQRKAMNARSNELIRLIDQVDKNQKTALLPEKLNELIVFLEPAASAESKEAAVKAPTKPLLRGAAPAKEKATVATKK